MCDYLPADILSSNRLTRLPIKTLLRCTSVCKSWYSLITNSPSFITSHLNMNANNHTPHLLGKRNINKNEENYCSIHCDDDTFKECDKLDFPFSSINKRFGIISSCNGLVCLSADYLHMIILWNQSLRKSNNLFMSYGFYMHSIGFGFVPTTNDYKVVRVFYAESPRGYKAPPKVEVYKLTTRSWRNVNAGDFPYVVRQHSPQVLLKSLVHWIRHNLNKVGGSFDSGIISFDLTNEKLGVLMVPTSLQDKGHLQIARFGESVSLVHCANNSSLIWVMNEYGVGNSWTKLFTIDDPGREKIGKVLHFRENGDILFVRQLDDFMFGQGDLVSYDPKSKQIKDLGLHGHTNLFDVVTYMESLILIKV